MPVAEDTERLAQGYAVLGRCWRQPDEALVEAINSGTLSTVVPDVESVTVKDLRIEHTRLFVGPGGPPCPPYESVYRDGEGDARGNVLGPSTGAVVTWYQAHGLGLDRDWSDLPDHVATELEFVSHLAADGSEDLREQFLDEHPRQWMRPFLDGVRAETHESFYAGLADATEDALF
ncbi:chaperone protein TorD [Halodesulfurarchaeum formicicum]|uniref:Chaperone protein TorD n=1 Tax=Halodesulfurarchaeum formicicum TaxID=1873524 RepID=A0A1D8S2Q2_9EURY|nr:molecular chaperone TorD family protein [Halodesulfurarchaeum formicicum]AOW79626.1 chaperone protein TorD [Halodesulfurarchaeum formicicum]APE94877.1 chaperone protein TorD [Halodesulfurarchaeum formicicum]